LDLLQNDAEYLKGIQQISDKTWLAAYWSLLKLGRGLYLFLKRL
jgi:hypothetical protein